MRWRFARLSIGISFFSLACSAQVGNEVLQGVNAVRVLVEDVPAALSDAGLVTSQLQTDAELKIRMAGLTITTEAPRAFVVTLSGTCRKDSGLCAYFVQTSLLEVGVLNRDSGLKEAVVRSWGKESYGSIGNERLRDLRDHAKDAVDRFLNDWLAANPKPSPIPAPRK